MTVTIAPGLGDRATTVPSSHVTDSVSEYLATGRQEGLYNDPRAICTANSKTRAHSHPQRTTFVGCQAAKPLLRVCDRLGACQVARRGAQLVGKQRTGWDRSLVPPRADSGLVAPYEMQHKRQG